MLAACLCACGTVNAVLTAENQTVARRTVRLDLRFELPVPPGGIPLAAAAWGR